MQKAGSIIAIIVGIIITGICAFALIKGAVDTMIIIGVIAGVLVIILGIVFMIRAKKAAEEEDDEEDEEYED